jgi:hypothetical protein
VYYSSNQSAAALLDTGTVQTQLPSDVFNDITAGFSVVNHTDYGPIVPCDLASADATVDFQFGNLEDGPTISINLSEWLDPIPAENGAPTFGGEQAACYWTMRASTDGSIILGDNFLRSAYIVYNLDGPTAAIGKANLNPGENNIQEIVEANNIPGASVTAEGIPSPTQLAPAFGASVAQFGSETSDIPYPQGSATFSLDFAAFATSSPVGSAAPSSTAGSSSTRSVPFVEKSIILVIGFSVFLTLLSGSLFSVM